LTGCMLFSGCVVPWQCRSVIRWKQLQSQSQSQSQLESQPQFSAGVGAAAVVVVASDQTTMFNRRPGT